MADRTPKLPQSYLQGVRCTAQSHLASDASILAGQDRRLSLLVEVASNLDEQGKPVPASIDATIQAIIDDRVIQPRALQAYGAARARHDRQAEAIEARQASQETRQAWRESCGLARQGQVAACHVAGYGARARLGFSYALDTSEPIEASDHRHDMPSPDSRITCLDRASMSRLGTKTPSKRKDKSLARHNKKHRTL